MPVHNTKFKPKGIAKTLRTLCEKYEAAKKAPAKRKTAKKRASKRDPAASKRKIKRRTAGTATGPWVFRDADSYITTTRTSRSPAKKRKAPKKRKTARRDWPGHPILHKRAALLGVRRTKAKKAKKSKAKKRSSARDWPGHPILHKRAALLGVRRKKAKKSKKRSSARDWPGHPILHKRAAKLGIRRAKRAGRRDPRHMGPTRRPGKNKVGHWDMSYTRAMRDSY